MTARANQARLFLTSTLIVSLIGSLLCGVARASERSAEKSIRLRAFAFGPIGRVYPVGGISINGRSVQGEQIVWGGEWLQAPDDAGACVLLDSIGQVTLTRGAVVRLATTELDADTKHYVLVGSLTSGDIVVKLEQNVTAYIEMPGLVLNSSNGASFRIGIREGQPVIDTIRGTVSTEFQRPIFKGRAARKGPGNVFVPVAESPVTSKTKSTKTVETLWTKLIPQTSSLRKAFAPRFVMVSNQRTQTEQPAAGRLVRFEVEPSVGNIIPPEKPTGPDGGVEVNFVAGPNPGNGTIRARIVPDRNDPPGTEYEEYTRPVIVTKAGFFSRNKLWIAAGAAAVVVTCVVGCGKSKPLQQQPPPNIP